MATASAPNSSGESRCRLALILTFLAIPMSYVNPRIGRSLNLVAAAFLYMLYTNCLNIVQSMIAQGRIGFWTGLLLPHAIAALLVVVLFRHQLSIAGLFRRAPRTVAPHPPAA
jgi:lipopolysaccharide export system permease protein